MLELAKRLRARIFQASTSEVCGEPSVHPQTENYWGNVNPVGIRSCYEQGKRCAEMLILDCHRQHQLEIKVARIPNTQCPRMHLSDGRVVSNFIMPAIAGGRSAPAATQLDDGLSKNIDYFRTVVASG